MEAAEDRKARLKALRAAAALSEEAKKEEAPTIKFRNYIPKDEELGADTIEAAPIPEFEQAKPEAEEEAGQEEVINVAPAKPNWDLKRDIQSRMEVLERRTQRALIEIMQAEERERLEQEGGIAD